MSRALILGGGGFIGSNLYATHSIFYDRVTVVDRFDGPAHPSLAGYDQLAASLRPGDRIIAMDVGDIERWPEILRGTDRIFILNADTGTAQSFLRPSLVVEENLLRIASLVEAIRQHCEAATTRIIFSSSRAVYGEGRWECMDHGAQTPDRTMAALRAAAFKPICPECGSELTLNGSLETDHHQPLSVYGLTKSAGEKLLRLTLCNSGFDVRIVRFQNVYGVGQAIDNPYTGVLNWFSRALIAGDRVKIYEQGHIVRDFIFVSDAVALLHRLASIDRSAADLMEPLVVNGGTGIATSLADAARLLREIFGSQSDVVHTSDFRPGDVLGALANVSVTKTVLGFEPQIPLAEGLKQYARWFRDQMANR